MTFLLKLKMQNIILNNSKQKIMKAYHVLNKNIAPSKVTDERRRKRGCQRHPRGNIQVRSKQLSLGMPRNASPLLSPTLSVTSLGAMFSFVTCYVFCLEHHASIWFMLFRIMFCIFIFNKNVKDSLYHAYFAVYLLLFQNRKFIAVAKIP